MSSLCGICELRRDTRPSVVWCKECDEGLCINCREHHSLSKATKRHTTIQTDEYQKTLTYRFDLAHICSKHNHKFQVFCKRHGCPCCSMCVVESHKDCKDITSIDDIVLSTKSATALNEIENMVYKFLNKVKQIRLDKETNFAKLKEQRKSIENEILQTRTKINEHLDKIQECVMKDLIEWEQMIERKTDEILASLQQITNELDKHQNNLGIIKKEASDIESFLASKQIEADVIAKEKKLQSYFVDGSLNNTGVTCKIDDRLQNLLNVQKFGQLSFVTKTPKITIVRRKFRSLQSLTERMPRQDIDHVTLTLQQTINKIGSGVYGCCLLPCGKMVFSNYHAKRLMIVNKDGTLDCFLTMPSYAGGIAIVDKNSVAVTSGVSNKEIYIFDLDKKLVQKSIPFSFCTDGIEYKDGSLIICAREEGIKMINVKDKKVVNISSTEMSPNAYITHFGEQLYYSNDKTQTVTCCNIDGRIQWVFKDPSVLHSPRGIVADKEGNIFVVDSKRASLVILSRDGKKYRQLTMKNNSLTDPECLFYDRLSNQLLVAHDPQTAFLYKLG